MLTGESVPIEAGAGARIYARALVRRGEAVAEVSATGARTKFGHTAELVRTAYFESTQQSRNCASCAISPRFNGVVIVTLAAYARFFLGMPLGEIVAFVLDLAKVPRDHVTRHSSPSGRK